MLQQPKTFIRLVFKNSTIGLFVPIYFNTNEKVGYLGCYFGIRFINFFEKKIKNIYNWESYFFSIYIYIYINLKSKYFIIKKFFYLLSSRKFVTIYIIKENPMKKFLKYTFK